MDCLVNIQGMQMRSSDSGLEEEMDAIFDEDIQFLLYLMGV